MISACLVALVVGAVGALPRAQGPAGGGKKPAPIAPRTSSAWNHIVHPLVEEYFARHPDLGFAFRWPRPDGLHLGTYGSTSSVRWREVLTDARADLSRLERKAGSAAEELDARVLSDWVDRELLLLQGQSQATTDPASYVRRALVTLRAASEAEWLKPDVRAAGVAGLLEEIPGYFRDARVCLISPAPEWTAIAIRDLQDLAELVDDLDRTLPNKVQAMAANRAKDKPKRSKQSPRDAVLNFRRWLLECLPQAGGTTPRLGGGEWQHLIRATSGTDWVAGELKAACLRDLAHLDLAARAESSKNDVPPDARLELAVDAAAENALGLARAAKLPVERSKASSLGFQVETSAREDFELVSLRPSGDTVIGFLELPHPSWSSSRTASRNRFFVGPARHTVLGIRHGLVGQAYLIHAVQRGRGQPPMLLENRLLREGLGLYALDWMPRIDWVENPFRGDEALAREIDFERGLEAARLVAALELHQEGLSVDEAVTGFQRRTGLDLDTCTAEVLAAGRDPLHGIAYLGLLELRALEERLRAQLGPRKALRGTLILIARHPELRPADIGASMDTEHPQR